MANLRLFVVVFGLVAAILASGTYFFLVTEGPRRVATPESEAEPTSEEESTNLVEKAKKGSRERAEIQEGRIKILMSQHALGEDEKSKQAAIDEALKVAREYVAENPASPRARGLLVSVLVIRSPDEEKEIDRAVKDCLRVDSRDAYCKRVAEAREKAARAPTCKGFRSGVGFYLAANEPSSEFPNAHEFEMSKIYLSRQASLGPQHILKAVIQKDGQREADFIWLQLNPEGTELMAKVTADNIDRYLVVIADNEILIAPRILGPIPGGRVQINPAKGENAERVLERLCLSLDR